MCQYAQRCTREATPRRAVFKDGCSFTTNLCDQHAGNINTDLAAQTLDMFDGNPINLPEKPKTTSEHACSWGCCVNTAITYIGGVQVGQAKLFVYACNNHHVEIERRLKQLDNREILPFKPTSKMSPDEYRSITLPIVDAGHLFFE